LLHCAKGPEGPVCASTISPAPDQSEDALSALLNLGYKEAQARKALAAIVIAPETPLEEILKSALKSLMR
jgi:Holliday junction DNA helicase RuvA